VVGWRGDRGGDGLRGRRGTAGTARCFSKGAAMSGAMQASGGEDRLKPGLQAGGGANAARELTAALDQILARRAAEFVAGVRADMQPVIEAQAAELAAVEVGRLLSGIHDEVAALRRDFKGAKPLGEDAVSDDEARRLFALLRELDSVGQPRKAPASMVFRLFCQEGLSRVEVAKRCGCVESLVTLRLKQIEAKLGRKPAELRQVSGHFERIEDSLSDPRARRLRRESAIDDDRFGEEDAGE
jgi:hypothetical protein